MKKIMLLLLLFSASKNMSQGTKGFQVVITHDNDFLGLGNEDENYTGGLKVEALFPEMKTKWLFIKYKSEHSLNVSRIGLGATAYTPQDLAEAAVVTGDRPYASLLFLNFGNNFYAMDRAEMVQSEFIVGLMGTSIPGNAQSHLHENHWFGSERPIPRGWDNQIGYNGSLILNYNTRFQKQITRADGSDTDFNCFIASGVGKIDIGNYMINLQAGMKFNFININSGIFQDSYVNMPTLIKEGKEIKYDYKEQNRKFRFSFFAEPNIRFVGYNATLEGLMFNDKSAYTIDHSDVKRVLFEFNAGFNMTICDFLSLKYAHFGRSREFEGGKSFHNWGAVTIGFSPARWNYK
ncbi:lipid A-modifier LpxR family protein [Flavobacterium sp. GT3P67]|uniref:lipid A-modifier LpxR family protein n=1 Tax=Flavobacterium sp. GT3P67 TaxID=2541722 RepID=UPI001051EB48|nr:lipid A-modifier LpxR family protein [Flavobacterium sp. GT3P67]TDE52714.1 lipid A deacylase LpxR family protein [Flavobacterium sp. GT3P67]